MTNKKIGIALIVIAIIAIGGLFFPQAGIIVREMVGASSGPEVYNHTSFRSGLTEGGFVVATSSVGAGTYTAANFVNSSGDTVNLIQHTAASALTATLPASSTLQAFIPNVGDSKSVFINAITTGITLAGGTGTELNSASTTKFINAGAVGRLDFVRKTNTDIEVLLTTGS